MIVVTVLLCVYIFSIVLIRVRCAVHHPLKRQMTNYSTLMVVFNLPAYLLSKVPLTPRVPKHHYPELDVLDEQWETIRDEALALYQNGMIKTKDDLPASSFYKDGRWTSFYLKVYDNDIPSAREMAPQTMALLDRVPSMHIALFACLNPGKKLSGHHDPFSYTLRYSLGLSTPNAEGCGLVVDGENYQWRDGDSIIFDETYYHSAYNETDKPRIILMTDVDRPLRWAWVQKIYYFFGWGFNRLFAVDNVDKKKSGFGNKLGEGVVAYRAFLRRVKVWNKPVYVAGKLTVLGLVLYGIGSSILN